MKKIIVFFVLICILALSACNDGNINDPIEIIKKGTYLDQPTVEGFCQRIVDFERERDNIDLIIKWQIDNSKKLRNKLSDYIGDEYDQIVRTDVNIETDPTAIEYDQAPNIQISIYWVVNTKNKLFEVVAYEVKGESFSFLTKHDAEELLNELLEHMEKY